MAARPSFTAFCIWNRQVGEGVVGSVPDADSPVVLGEPGDNNCLAVDRGTRHMFHGEGHPLATLVHTAVRARRDDARRDDAGRVYRYFN